jgi:hypothetical protein
MKPLLAIAVAIALLALGGPAMAQTGDPFNPVDPSGPLTPPPEPEPPPQQPVAEDDDELGLTESLALAGIAALIIGAVFVAITREGRRMERRRRAHRGRKSRRGAAPADLHRRSTTAARAGATGERRSEAKRPPPPPRKRRPKAKRR